MDRKAWIVVSLCGVLLIVNLWFGAQNAELQKQQEAEKAAQEAAQIEALDPAAPSAGLSADDRPSLVQVDEKTTTIDTPEAVFELSSLGGGVVSTTFKNEKSVYDLEQQVRMNDLGRHRVGSLVTLSGQALEQKNYTIKEDADGSITYRGVASNGLGVTKKWSRVPSEQAGRDYRLRLSLTLTNLGDGAFDLSTLALSTGSAAPLYVDERPDYLNFFWQEDGDYESETAGYFKGGIFSKEKSEFRERIENLEFAGVENQFFATIVDPVDDYAATVQARPQMQKLPLTRGDFDATVLMTYISLPEATLAAKNQRTFEFDIFMGPKRNSLLRDLPGEKGGVMNYGFFSPISRFLNSTLNWFANLFGAPDYRWAWGFAVIALTVFIRTLMWPLHAKSTRTMKRMSKLQPEMAKLKEKYPDDPNKLNQETMKLYQKFGVNPMGGCLPLIFQIPIFFGFFTMLQYAVELRNEGFMWVDDLSQPDTIGHVAGLPINLLPILMAVTMVLQMRMTPQTGDKLQRRIFMLMPLIFFFFCYNFASALALYWTTQNIFSIAQTWLMQKMPEPELKTGKNAGKKTWVQKMAERAEEAQKLQKQGKGTMAAAREVQARAAAKKAAKKSGKKRRQGRTGGK